MPLQSAVSTGAPLHAATRQRVGRSLVLAAALALAVLAAFAPVVRNGFVNFDDNTNLVDNPGAHQDFTLASLRWAFTTVQSQNWHPLTWLSHMLDFRLFGPWAGGHHAVSALIHAANAALLLLALHAMTGALWRSALVAALFGLHPLRVESVAWASERKDVLAVLFGLLALCAYLRYVRRRTAGSYAAALALFACALMSKAMLVSLPGILLLLDLWPLGRWSPGRNGLVLPGRRLLLEKLPFLALSAAASLITFLVQDSAGAVAYVDQFPLRVRVGNAFLSYGAYLAKTLWPAKLAVFYPYFWQDVPWWQPVLGAAVVAAGAGVALLLLRRRPVWFVGWSWYLGTLLPVIGIVQVGSQSMADRYTYLPQIGILLLVSWGLGDLAKGRPGVRTAILAGAPLVLAALAAATWVQVTRWRDDVTLFSHAVQVTDKNFVAFTRLGAALVERGRLEEGREYIARSFKVEPAARASVFDATGDYYARLGMVDAAAEQYRKALAIEPFKEVLQEKLRALGRTAKAPSSGPPADPHARPPPHGAPRERGDMLARSGRFEEAVSAYREAIRADPGNYGAWHNLGCALSDLRRNDEAAAAFEETLRLKPDHASARKNLEAVRRSGGRP